VEEGHSPGSGRPRSRILGRFGFEWEPAENFIRDAVPVNDVLPEQLAEFYRHVGEMCLTDIDVGCFVYPASIVVSADNDELPRRLTGAVEADVCTFGADGGGNLFSLDLATGSVYFVPLSEVKDGTWVGAGEQPRATGGRAHVHRRHR
jgi:hypothetical protein